MPSPSSRRLRRAGTQPRTTGVAVALLAPLLLGGCQLAGAMAPRGTDAARTASLWWFMLLLGGGIFLGWTLLFLVGLFRRGRVMAGEEQESRLHRRFIVGGGVVLPAFALGSLFVYNLAVLGDLPRGADVVIEATGRQFWWEFSYPDPGFTTANEMYVPVGRDVQVQLRTDDVIHSFWVPQLGGKRDMVPDRVNELTIHATEPGRFLGECAEYCGIQHATMRFEVVAVEPPEFERWLAHMAQPAAEPETEAGLAGREAFLSSSCVSCHAIRGTAAEGRVGPELTHFGSRRLLGAGAAANDRGHLGGWVVNAQALKPGNLMPPVPLDAAAVDDLITYLHSLE